TFFDILIKHPFSYFFFSSRRRHTRSKRDWSSDVCSSDLSRSWAMRLIMVRLARRSCMLELSLMSNSWAERGLPKRIMVRLNMPRSEERRVGKECRNRWIAERRIKNIDVKSHTLLKINN